MSKFAADEGGAVTTDAVVFWAGLILMAQTVVTDVSHGVMIVADGISGAIGEIAATNLTLQEIAGLAGQDATPTAGEGTQTPSSGNPGNDKDVGRAGENPNGTDDWGTGSQGRSQ
ncbi:hypothetical protein [Maritimibacter alexandrii]|uniref:hypothetical protein n=1 Tax=Maritimibacter alexandrii TaxID=2570355 RepID=UPI001109AD3B|nr:hypothetical protein [Maritimibacter alexandrii]